MLAFPAAPILRQWVELDNTGTQPAVLASPRAGCWRLRGDDAPAYKQSWMFGAAAGPNQGKLEQAPVAAPYSHKLEGDATA